MQYVANGLVVGGLIALVAVGLTLIYGILKLTNFAYGDMVTFGAYMALFFNLRFGLSPWWGVLLAFGLGAFLGVASEWLIWRKMRRLRAGPVSLIVASIGFALLLRNLLVFFFSTQSQSFDVPIRRAIAFGPVAFTPDELRALLAAVVGVFLVHALLRYTTVGRAMRAMADNMDLAWVSGVQVERVIVWTWVLGGGLAALGGALYGMVRPIDPNMGWFLLLPMFAAIILGGLGNPYGAIVGGFLIGLAQEVSVAFLPAEYKLGVGFLVMIVVLLVFPRGILGERSLS